MSRHPLLFAAAGAVAAACSASGGTDPNGGPLGSSGSGPNGSGGAGAGVGVGTGTGASSDQIGDIPSGGRGSGTAPDGGWWPPESTGEPECIPPPPVEPPEPTLITLDECTGKVDAGTQAALEGGGAGGLQVLYPYDGTIFPGGLLAPIVQWDHAGATDAVRITIKSQYLDYAGCFGANAEKRISIPDSVWKTAEQQTGGAADPFNVTITVMSGGSVLGPINAKWVIARGNLQGALFYNTYDTPQTGVENGAIMRLILGAPTPEIYKTEPGGTSPTGPCWGCHSLSAQGNVLVGQRHFYPLGPYESAAFNVTSAINPTPTRVLDGNVEYEMGLGAVSPDGSKVLTMGSPANSTGGLFPDGDGNVPAMIGPKESVLLDTATGQVIPMTGFDVQYAKMPQFSPDGSKVVFNWHEDANGHSLGVADFDQATNTASNVRRIYSHDTLYPGWPFFTPDNKEVIFVLGDTNDYVSAYPIQLGPNPTEPRPVMASSSLYIVDVETGAARFLALANGYPSEGAATYLPRPGRDEHLEFFPTVSPVASGGYFWLFFTSRRTYGNIITEPAVIPNPDPNAISLTDPITKKIWVSAINIRAPGAGPIPDPSNAPFYLPGQETESGNIRAFAALEPCRQDGDSCDSGIDCCGGHCYQGSCGLPPPGDPICMEPPPPPCSELEGRCNTANDCCDDEAECVAGYCIIPEPVIIR